MCRKSFLQKSQQTEVFFQRISSCGQKIMLMSAIRISINEPQKKLLFRLTKSYAELLLILSVQVTLLLIIFNMRWLPQNSEYFFPDISGISTQVISQITGLTG